VTKQPLHEADVDPSFDQKGRRGMAEHVRCNSPFQSRLRSKVPQLQSNGLGLHSGSKSVDQKRSVLSHYEAQVAALQTAMTQELRRGDSEPARILRELIETVTVKAEPSAPSGLRIEIAGRLRALLGERAFPNGSVVCGSMVAEDGFEPPTHGL
jgi:hypothetical protein